MNNIFGMTRKALEDYFIAIGEKKFKAVQVYEWLYQKRVFAIDEFSNIKKETQERMKQDFDTHFIQIEKKQEEDLTKKYLFRLKDGEAIEAVVMMHDYGISVCDISTGEFYSAEIKDNYNFPMLLDELARYTPSELVVNSMMADCSEEMDKIKERFENVYVTRFNDKFFNDELNNINLRFNIVDNNGKKIEDISDKRLAISSINALIEYIEETQKTSLDHINKITIYQISKYMSLDINFGC